MSSTYTEQTSIEYYNSNARQFIEQTSSLDLSNLYDEFLGRICPGGAILDVGCGSGRDTKAFIEKGYDVTAFDASSEMVKLASETTNKHIICANFDEFTTNKLFDGIWACASLLHVPTKKLATVVSKLSKLLKPYGVMYLSFKYGDTERFDGQRIFSDMNEEKIHELMNELPEVSIEKHWKSTDLRGDGLPPWLNIIIRLKM